MKRWILVTGASSGIGLEIVRHLDSLNYNVILCARREEKLKDITSALKNEAIVMPVDLCNLLEIEKIFMILKKAEIRLNGMVHCAGTGNTLPVRNNNVEAMQKIMATNYFSFVKLGKYFSKKIYSNEGASIVAISSISPLTCYTGACNYAASKSAFNIAVKIMSKEFMKRKIRVNAILPAYVNAPLGPAEDDEEYIKQQPLGIIQPEYVAYLVEFLLSDKSKYMTGTLIPISGGMSF